MKVVKASYKGIKEQDIFKKIERVARVCYKSEDKISDGTDKKMVEMLIKNNHLAMLEHATLCYRVDAFLYSLLEDILGSCVNQIIYTSDVLPINRIRISQAYNEELGVESYVVSGNIRAWYEFFVNMVNRGVHWRLLCILWTKFTSDTCGVFDDLVDIDLSPFHENYIERVTDFSKLLPQERMMHETVSILFMTDRGVTHELVRMRDCSFAQESTRYCNYSLGKFGSEITFIKPRDSFNDEYSYAQWCSAMSNAEMVYNNLIAAGVKPQDARGVLPQNTKADIVVTTNLAEWRHIFELRAYDYTGPAHPQMKEVMVPLAEEKIIEYPFAFGDLKAK